jgi:diguanylate cyclase (GGDEF)-like protein
MPRNLEAPLHWRLTKIKNKDMSVVLTYSKTSEGDESVVRFIRNTLDNEPAMLRVPDSLKAQFQQYRLRGLDRYVLSGAPPLAVLTLGLTIITSWIMFTSMNDHDKQLWILGSTLLSAIVVFGGAAMMLPLLRRFYPIAVPALSSIALIKLASFPQLFEDPSISAAESYFCVITIIIIVLALKLSPLSSAIAIYSAGLISLALLNIGEYAISYVDFFYYYVVPAKVCLFVSILRDQQEIKEFFQDRLISFDKEEMERLNLELSNLANYDPLSGLANRRKFDEAMKVEWERHIRNHGDIAVVFIDLDHFKAFNDTYGHAMGDDCLEKIGKGIRNSLMRPTDLAARYGGEEFVVLLPNTNARGAMDVAKRILDSIEGLNIPHRMSPIDHVTASIGFASMSPTQETTPSTLLKRADDALYQAKHRGRNQAVAWAERPEQDAPCSIKE